MVSAIKSLWSEQIKPNILSPRQILAAQASVLTELTNGVLIGELAENKREDKEIVFTLDMFAPAINYRHRVLIAKHSPTLLYPVLLDADIFRAKGLAASLVPSTALREIIEGKKPASQADSDDELVRLVEKVLKSSEVVSKAQSLIALSNEVRIPINFLRDLQELSEEKRLAAVEEKIAETVHEILDSEVFANSIAETNASDWGMDEYEIQNIDLRDKECIARLAYTASGVQVEDKPYSGDTVKGTAESLFDAHGDVKYRAITAEVVHDTEEPGSEADFKQPQ